MRYSKEKQQKESDRFNIIIYLILGRSAERICDSLDNIFDGLMDYESTQVFKRYSNKTG